MKFNSSRRIEIEMEVLRLKAEVECCECPRKRRQMTQRLKGLCELLGIKLHSAHNAKKPPSLPPKMKLKRSDKKNKASQRASSQDSMVKLAANVGPIRIVQGGGVNGK